MGPEIPSSDVYSRDLETNTDRWQSPSCPAVASPGSSHPGLDVRNNKMAENEEFLVSEGENNDCANTTTCNDS